LFKIINHITIFFLKILWLPALILSIYYYYTYRTGNIGFTPEQPVKFSHKVHSGNFGMKCLFCHGEARKNSYSAIPSTYACMVCHIALKTETELMKPVNYSYDNKKPIVWNRIYILPDYTHFNHSRHINAMIDCSSCHGEVDKMEMITQVRALTMQWCLDCHRQPEKFIIPPKNISGIFIFPQIISKLENNQIKLADNIDMTIPPFGMFLSELPKIIDGFSLSKLPGKGPENCSACHY